MCTGPGPGYSYLVTPDGQMFRMRSMGAVYGAGKKRLGTKVTYAGESSGVAAIRREAELLAHALGPEMDLAGEKTLLIETTLGHDPGKFFSASTSYLTIFERTATGWVRQAAENDPAEGSSVTGKESSKVAEDTRFPFDRAGLVAAGEATGEWLAALDQGREKDARLALAEQFRDEVDVGARWIQMIQYRRGVTPTTRVELYRLQIREASSGNARAAMFQFEVAGQNQARFIERVSAFEEEGTWRVSGYALRPISGP